MANFVNRYLKLSVETTFKEAFSDPVDTILYAKTAQVKPVHSEIEIMEGYQRGASRVGPGMVSTEASIETAADLNQLIFFLNRALTGYLYTDTTTNVHEVFSDEKFLLKSFQIATGMDDHEAQTRGAGINTLAIGVSGGELNITAECIGSTYDKTTIDDTLTAASFDNADFLTFANVVVKLDDVDISCPETKEFTININNSLSVEDAQRVGSRERCLNIAGDLEVTVDFTMYRNSTQFLEAYLGDTNTFSDTGATSHKLSFEITDKDDNVMIITIPSARVTSNDYATSGNDIVDESSTFKANLGNVTLDDEATVIETLIYCILDKELDYTLN